jgi:tetratricopeptide (TPR) repeat protein
MPFRRRRDLHERIGEQLEARDGAAAAEQCELLSLHFHRAQRYDKAWRYSRMAGQRAQKKYANVAAAEFYDRALDAARRNERTTPEEMAETAESLGDVRELIGSYHDASDAYRRAFVLSERRDDARMRLIRKQGVVRERLGQYSQALRWYGRGLRSLERRTSPELLRHRVELGIAYAGVRYRQGRYLDCTRWCQRVVKDAEALNDRKSLAHAYYLLDAAYTDLGSADSETYRLRALPIFEELGDLIGQANVLNNLGVDAYFEGRWDEALRHYERSRSARERSGDVVGIATAANNLGEILSDQGHFDEAEAYFREAFNIWRAAGYQMGVGVARSNQGRLAMRRGALKEAGELLRTALDELNAIGAGNFAVDTEARIAEHLLYTGDAPAALRAIDGAAARLAATGGSAFTRAALLRLKGCALAQMRLPVAAATAIEDSLELARSLGATYEVALTLQAQAEIDAATRSEAAREVETIFATLGVTAGTPPPTRPLAVG